VDQPYFVAIAGGSSSGKTTLAKALQQRLGSSLCSLIPQDNYYFGQAQCDNFDLPQAIEVQLLARHLHRLKSGHTVKIPTYDFSRHKRGAQEIAVASRPVIIIEGTLVLHWQELKELLDLSIFVECDQQLRLERRVQRDSADRGRTEHDIKQQFSSQVEPCHQQFVEPCKTEADLVIDGTGTTLDKAVTQILDTSPTLATLVASSVA
jgi:uridine kinase